MSFVLTLTGCFNIFSAYPPLIDAGLRRERPALGNAL